MLETEIKKLTVAMTELTAAMHTVRLPAAQTALAKVAAANPIETKAESTSKAPDSSPKAAKKDETPDTDTVPVTAGAGASPPVATGAADSTAADAALVPTKKQLVDKFIKLAQDKDRTVAVALLARYGIVKLPELKDKTKWAGFMAEIDVLLAA